MSSNYVLECIIVAAVITVLVAIINNVGSHLRVRYKQWAITVRENAKENTLQDCIKELERRNVQLEQLLASHS